MEKPCDIIFGDVLLRVYYILLVWKKILFIPSLLKYSNWMIYLRAWLSG